MAALQFTLLEQSSNHVDNSVSYTTGSISPTANRYVEIFVFIQSTLATTDTVSGISGCGLTWVEQGTAGGVLFNTSKRRLQCFRSMGASPTTGALTITLTNAGAQPTIGCMWAIVQSTADVDTTGTNGSGAVVQTGSNSNGNATTITPSPALNAFGDATNNVTLACAVCNNNTTWTTDSTPAGWVELCDGLMTTPSASITVGYLTGQDTAPTFTQAGATAPIAMIAHEIKYAAAAAVTKPPSLLALTGVN